MVDGKNDEVVGNNQWNMDKRADAENQEMQHNADFRWAPLPKPDCTLVLFKVNTPTSIRSSRDFRRTGIRKLSENPGICYTVSHITVPSLRSKCAHRSEEGEPRMHTN